MDWPKKDYASVLFGAGESSDILLTAYDEIVIIDAEQMFNSSIKIGNSLKTHWCYEADGNKSISAKEIKIEIYRDLLALSYKDLDECLYMPKGVDVNELWSVADCIKASRRYAQIAVDMETADLSI